MLALTLADIEQHAQDLQNLKIENLWIMLHNDTYTADEVALDDMVERFTQTFA